MAYELMEDEAPEESFLETGLRNVGRQAANLGTRAIGFTGDLASLVNDYIANPIVKGLGGPDIPYEKSPMSKSFPTTQQFRESTKQQFGGYPEPKNKIESFIDDVVEDTALLSIPGGRVSKTAQTAKKASALPLNFSKALGANLFGESVGNVTGSETAKDATKLGSLFFLSLINTPKAAEEISKLYGKAEFHLPKDAATSAESLTGKLDGLKYKITKDRPSANLAPSEKFVIGEIEKVESMIENGNINISKAWAQKRSLNESLQAHIFDTKDRGAQKRAKNLAKPIVNFLNKTIEEYGKNNPKFYGPFKEADKAFGVIGKSNLLSNFVENNIKYSPVTHGLLHLFGSGIGSTSSALAVPYIAGKLGYRVANSPVIRKIYTNAVKEATNGNSVAFNKYLKLLDEELQKDENNDRFEFVD